MAEGDNISGNRRTESGTVFKRQLKAGNTLQPIKDMVVSPFFVDVYDGEDTFLRGLVSEIATPRKGVFSLGSSFTSGEYIIETPIKRKPNFGAGEFFGLDLNLYHSDLNYNQEGTYTDIEVYKFNRSISSLTKGVFGEPAAAKGNLIVGSMSIGGGGAGIVETFDGLSPFDSSLTTGKTKLQSTKRTSDEGMYLEVDDAWNIRNDYKNTRYVGRGWMKSKGTFKDRYAKSYEGRKIIPLEHRSSSILYSSLHPKHGRKLSRGDFDLARSMVDSDYRESKGEDDIPWYGNVLKWKGDKTAVETLSQNLDEAKIASATITPEDSIFDRVLFTNSLQKEVTEEGVTLLKAYSVPIFSNANSPPSGSSAQFVTLHGKDEPAVTYAFNGTQIPYQSIVAQLRIPKPLQLARKHATSFTEACTFASGASHVVTHGGNINIRPGLQMSGTHVDSNTVVTSVDSATQFTMSNGDTGNGASTITFTQPGDHQMDSLEINIKFSINRLDAAYASGQEYKLGLTRTFGVLFSTRPMGHKEDLSAMLRKHRFGARTWASLGGLSEERAHPQTGELKNIYNGLFFIRVPEATLTRHIVAGDAWPNWTYDGGLNSTSSQNGEIMAFTAGTTENPNFGGAVLSDKDADGTPICSPGGFPFVSIENASVDGIHADETGADGSRINLSKQKIGKSSAPNTSFVTGEYYTLKMLLNHKGNVAKGGAPSARGSITYILLNKSNDICFMQKVNHLGHKLHGDGDASTAATSMNNQTTGFPSYLHIIVNGMKIGIDTSDLNHPWTTFSEYTGATEYFSAPMDGSTDVTIDSISISGFEGEMANATLGDFNKNPTAITISGNTDRNIIDDDYSVDADNYNGTFDTLKGMNIGEILETGPTTAVPTYISWGAKTDIWNNSKLNVFLGNFSSADRENNDATDVEKSVKFATSGSITGSNVMLLYPDGHTGNDLGMWLVEDRNQNVNVDHHFNDLLTFEGTNSIDKFTKKGWFTIDFTGTPSRPTNRLGGSFVARENPAFSTKVLDISNISKGELIVANSSILHNFKDDDFIIYRAGYTYASTHYRNDLTIKNVSSETDSIEIDTTSSSIYDIALASDETTPLITIENLHELYISPKRFWSVLEIFNQAESGGKILPDKKYGYSLIQQGLAPESTTVGASFNETKYSDTSYDSNQWVISDSSGGGLIENQTDYGFGAMSSSNDDASIDRESGIGYINKYSPQDGYNNISLDNLVIAEGSRFKKPDEVISLYVRAATEASGVSLVSTTNRSEVTRGSVLEEKKPQFTFYYFDAKPTINNFTVSPNEVDPFYPTYTWDVQDDDLWYGFIILSNSEIKHQYDGAVAHIPLNETDVLDYKKIYLYKHDGTNAGLEQHAQKVNTTNKTTVEGLAGNALLCEGETLVSFSDGSYTQPTDQMSIVAHFSCDDISTTRYILSKRGEFNIFIDTSGNVNATLLPASGTTIELKSTSLVNTDGETPTNVILTFDETLPTGNVKLFINGKLEDQSGVKNTTGSKNNWKTGQDMATSSTTELTIGYKGHASGLYPTENPHSGTIEEIVIYNKVIYPVIPQDKSLTIYKPVKELTTSDSQAGLSNVARLFIKDYHNIRGTLVNEVASSSLVAFRKSGLGLYNT